ncbi:MAG: hypothetical protein MN733_21080 [Nitrososphaera sp.]|nr:hypothetical protein [Nitrososphaera sp.]
MSKPSRAPTHKSAAKPGSKTPKPANSDSEVTFISMRELFAHCKQLALYVDEANTLTDIKVLQTKAKHVLTLMNQVYK